MPAGTRKLVAIMFTDIAGYTALMGEDEQKAIRALERSREVIRSQVPKHGGTLLEEIGDGSLSSFESAVSAVECAREIQQQVGPDPDFDLRIGIHIGDVLLTGSKVIGDGVNVASRIHGLADPGAIAISDRVYDDVRNHPEFRATPLGERRLKNVNRRVMVYVMSRSAATVTAGEPSARTLPSRRWRHLAIAAAILAAIGGGIWATGLHERIALALMLNLPLLRPGEVEQEIGFVTSKDGTRIAYASAGEGPPLVHVVGWATHVERGLLSPAYSPSVAHFARDYRYVRYDGRGAGLSDRNITDFSYEAKIADLEAVIDGLGLDRVALLGLSAGGPTSIGYTVRHPEKIDRLVLVATAASAASVQAVNPIWTQIPDMIRGGWSGQSSAARRMFISLLIPEAPPLQHDFLSELLRVSMTGEDAANFFSSLVEGDVTELLPQVRVPTLIVHARGDLLVPYEAGGRELAAGIAGARLVVLESNNHGIPPTDPVYPQFLEVVSDFLAEGSW